MSFRLTKWVGTTAAASISAFTVFSGSATGFFPPIPTGNDPPTVAPQVPVVPPVITVPPTQQPIVPATRRSTRLPSGRVTPMRGAS